MKTNGKTILRRTMRSVGALAILAGTAMLATGAYLYLRFGDAKAVTPPASRQIAPEKRDFKVAFFGDFAMQSHVFIPVLQQISAAKPDFAVSVGDMFRVPQGGEGPYLTEMLFDNLTVPFCAIPGNHDGIGERDFSSYCRYFGAPYYFFSYGDTLFVMLNDSLQFPTKPEHLKLLPPVPRERRKPLVFAMDERELAWLENVLAHYRKEFRRCVFVMHVPPVAPERSRDYASNIIVHHQIENIVRKYPVDAIVSGHLHVSAKSDFQGIPVYHVPCCGQTIRDKVHPDFGYLTLHFTDAGAIEATPCYLAGLERGRNYFLNALVTDIPGNRRYYYSALVLLIAGFGLVAMTRGKS